MHILALHKHSILVSCTVKTTSPAALLPSASLTFMLHGAFSQYLGVLLFSNLPAFKNKSDPVTCTLCEYNPIYNLSQALAFRLTLQWGMKKLEPMLKMFRHQKLKNVMIWGGSLLKIAFRLLALITDKVNLLWRVQNQPLELYLSHQLYYK